MRGWPVTLTERDLLDAPVGLRPVRVKDASVWRETRMRNATWLRPWEPTNPETPLYQTSLGPYVSMARTMRHEAKQAQTLRSFADASRSVTLDESPARVLRISISQNYPSAPGTVTITVPIVRDDLDLAHAQLPAHLHIKAWTR